MVDFITFTRQYPDFLFPGKTQLDESANPIRESNQPLIDSINPFSWWRTARALRSRDPALIVFNWWHPFFGLCYGAIVQLLPRALRNRVCFLCHNVLPHERTRLERLLSAFAFRHVRRFIVHSEEDKQTLLKLKPDAQALRTVTRCLRSSGGHPAHRQGCCAGTIEAASRAQRRAFFRADPSIQGAGAAHRGHARSAACDDCSLLVAGEFYDDKSKYTALIDRLELRARVRIEDAYIPNEDVTVFRGGRCCGTAIYRSEPERNRADRLQLQYAGDFTRVGGLPEAVLEDKTGLLVEAGDPAALARAIVRYYQQGYEARFRAGIAQYVDRFGCEEEARSIEQFMQAAGAAMSAAGPDVSVIIPCFRSRDTIGLTIESLLQQDFLGTMQVLVADSSDDGTAEWIRTSFPDVEVHHSETRLLPGPARNFGFEKSRGRFIAFIDADAQAARHRLSTLHRRLNEDVGMTMIGAAVGNANPETAVARVLYWLEFSDFLPRQPPRFCRILSSSNLLLRRETFVKAKGFDPAYGMSEDMVFSLAIGRGLYLETATHILHRHRTDWTVVKQHLDRLGFWSGRYRATFAVSRQLAASRTLAEFRIDTLPVIPCGAAYFPARATTPSGVVRPS